MKRAIDRLGLALILVTMTAPNLAAAQDEDEAWLSGGEGGEEGAKEGQPPDAEGETGEGETDGGETPEEGESADGGDGEVVSEGGDGEDKPVDKDDAWLAGKEVKEVEAPEEDTTYQLKEDKKKWYFGLGARARYYAVPAGEQQWFGVQKAETVHAWGAGIEAVFRHKGLSIVPAVWFTQIKSLGTVYQEKGDPRTDAEIWDINLKLLVISIDFMGSYTIKDWLYFTYGAGLGFMFRLGSNDMVRTEACYEAGSWSKCTGVDSTCGGDPDFCEAGGHYKENWKGWKADPFYVPFVDILLGLRFKPVPNLYIAIDTGIILPVLPTVGTRIGYIF